MHLVLRWPTRTTLALGAIAALAVTACRPSAPALNTILVQANDYAFTAPDSVPAGQTAFGLANAGKMPHEIIIIRLKPNATVQEILRLDRADSTWRDLRDAPSGILTADPGVTTPGHLLLHLQSGERYLVVCNFRDSETAPAHFHLGMFKLITVHASRS